MIDASYSTMERLNQVIQENARLRAHIEAPDGDLVEAVDAWVAAAVEVAVSEAVASKHEIMGKLSRERDEARRACGEASEIIRCGNRIAWEERDAARAEVERLTFSIHKGEVALRAERAEVERLTTKCGEWSERCGTLTAEVERLRGLLRELDPFARYGLSAYCHDPKFSRLIVELEALRG